MQECASCEAHVVRSTRAVPTRRSAAGPPAAGQGRAATAIGVSPEAAEEAGVDAGDAAATHTVSVTNFAYTPAELTIKLGDTVEWVWEEGTHTVSSGTDCVADKKIESGQHSAPFTPASSPSNTPGASSRLLGCPRKRVMIDQATRSGPRTSSRTARGAEVVPRCARAYERDLRAVRDPGCGSRPIVGPRIRCQGPYPFVRIGEEQSTEPGRTRRRGDAVASAERCPRICLEVRLDRRSPWLSRFGRGASRLATPGARLPAAQISGGASDPCHHREDGHPSTSPMAFRARQASCGGRSAPGGGHCRGGRLTEACARRGDRRSGGGRCGLRDRGRGRARGAWVGLRACTDKGRRCDELTRGRALATAPCSWRGDRPPRPRAARA